MKYYYIYLIVINILTFYMFMIDKYYAKHHKKRIPESHLIMLLFIFGLIGGYLSMKIFNHKTKKKKFKLALILSLISMFIINLYFGGKW